MENNDISKNGRILCQKNYGHAFRKENKLDFDLINN